MFLIFFIYLFYINQDKINKMKNLAAKNESDKRKLKEAFEISEQRATKLELARRALEGDLQRLKLAQNDKETTNQVGNFCRNKNLQF